MKKTIDFFGLSFFLVALLYGIPVNLQAQCLNISRLYVDQNSVGLNDGSSWTDAYTDLQDALTTAGNCPQIQEIWVAQGVYTPTSLQNPDISFELVNGVAMYGGFTGIETQLEERSLETAFSILSGDLGTTNSYHVVTGTDLNANTKVDGFVIRDGRIGPGFSPILGPDGVGMLLTASSPSAICTPSITNCSFEFNFNDERDGGAMALFDANPTIDNCRFLGNTSKDDGGGIYVEGSKSLNITNCYFINNRCEEGGGGVFADNQGLDIENCVFADNYAEIVGGGAIITGSQTFLAITNSTFHANRVDEGTGAALLVFGSTNIYNSIFWENGRRSSDLFLFRPVIDGNVFGVTMENSIFQGGWTGVGMDNIDQNPEFVGEFSHDYRIRSNSPAREGGLSVYTTLPRDLQGLPRILEDEVDMGALEFSPICLNLSRIYVNPNASGTGDGSSWTNAYHELKDALLYANTCYEVTEVWVAQGSYSPAETSQEMLVPRTSPMGATFHMRADLKVFGGFAGNETSLAERNLTNNHSILEGDIGIPANQADNIVRIVSLSHTNAVSQLDGFRIQHNDDLPASTNKRDSEGMKIAFSTDYSSGLYAGFLSDTNAVFTMSNCVLDQLSGTGIYTKVEQIDVENCSFSNIESHGILAEKGKLTTTGTLNISGSYFTQITGNTIRSSQNTSIEESEFFQNPGRLFSDNNLKIDRSIFRENTPGFDQPVLESRHTLSVINSLFAVNTVEKTGTVLVDGGSAHFLNSTFYGNTFINSLETAGSMVIDTNDSVFVENCILWESIPSNPSPFLSTEEIYYKAPINPSVNLLFVSNTNVSGGWPGTGNTSHNPKFINTTAANLNLGLLASSASINAGSNTPLAGTVDLAGNQRIKSGVIDQGAYEHQGPILIESVELFRIPDWWTRFKILVIEDQDLIRWPDEIADLNLAANPSRDVGSMSYVLDGEVHMERIANQAPFGLFGEEDRPFLPPGRYELTAIPYELPNAESPAGEAHTISFQVIGEEESPEVAIAPNPNNGIFSLLLPEDWEGETTLTLLTVLGDALWESFIESPRTENEVILPTDYEGEFILHIRAGERVETLRLVVNR